MNVVAKFSGSLDCKTKSGYWPFFITDEGIELTKQGSKIVGILLKDPRTPADLIILIQDIQDIAAEHLIPKQIKGDAISANDLIFRTFQESLIEIAKVRGLPSEERVRRIRGILVNCALVYTNFSADCPKGKERNRYEITWATGDMKRFFERRERRAALESEATDRERGKAFLRDLVLNK